MDGLAHGRSAKHWDPADTTGVHRVCRETRLTSRSASHASDRATAHNRTYTVHTLAQRYEIICHFVLADARDPLLDREPDCIIVQ